MDELERYRRRQAVRQQHLRRLGVRNVYCPMCGVSDPICFEADHIDRRANSDVVYGICKNCHARKSAREQSEHPPVGLHPSDPFEAAGHFLLGVCEYLSFIIERLRELAEMMFGLAGKALKPVEG